MKKNNIRRTVILMMFGVNHLCKISQAEKEENADWFNYFRRMLLEAYDYVPDYRLTRLGLHVKFADHIIPDYGKPLEMDLFTTNITGLREGRGNMYFSWPEDFYDFLLQKGVELNQIWHKEGSDEE